MQTSVYLRCLIFNRMFLLLAIVLTASACLWSGLPLDVQVYDTYYVFRADQLFAGLALVCYVIAGIYFIIRKHLYVPKLFEGIHLTISLVNLFLVYYLLSDSSLSADLSPRELPINTTLLQKLMISVFSFLLIQFLAVAGLLSLVVRKRRLGIS